MSLREKFQTIYLMNNQPNQVTYIFDNKKLLFSIIDTEISSKNFNLTQMRTYYSWRNP